MLSIIEGQIDAIEIQLHELRAWLAHYERVHGVGPARLQLVLAAILSRLTRIVENEELVQGELKRGHF
jgi:hypothetical protein